VSYADDITSAPSTTPYEPTGEELATQQWLRWGRMIVLDRKIYKDVVTSICNAEIKRIFDRHLARLAADSPTIHRTHHTRYRFILRLSTSSAVPDTALGLR
jgi:hypothetical protein